MAGLKKKKKEKSGSPNVILVVFLVLFVLTSIGLGVWGYYGYAGQEVLRKQRRDADIATKSEKNAKVYFQMLWRDLRQAIGQKLDGDDLQQLELDRDEFLKDKGAFSEEKTRDAARAFMAEVHDNLGLPKDAKSYDKNFMEELKAARAKITEIQGATAVEIAKHEKTKEMVAALKKDQDLAYQTIKDKINKENNDIFVEVQKQSEAFKKLAENNAKLNKDIADQAEENNKKIAEYEQAVRAKDRLITILVAEKKENVALGGAGPGGAPAGPGGGNNMTRGELFPLLLDISTRKPLWDLPVGKIVRVDLDLRQVTINLGSVHGAKPELTFNVFGPGPTGRAEKQMKGTIEIIKVGENSSQCRITSLYDSEGIEILMNLKSRGQILRETEAPMKDGDLLFNLFWGTRVAVAGYVSITGEKTENPAEQYRQLIDFVGLCKRNGMIVDAYVDVRNGEIKGKINAKTRYLIRGDDLVRPDSKNQGPKKIDPDDKDKEMADKDKEPAREGGVGERIDLVNRASQKLSNDARDKGLLLISAENFANVIGYQKARSANSIEISGFRPTLPYAGVPGEGGVVVQPAPPPPQEKEMPKEKEKEKEKDAGN